MRSADFDIRCASLSDLESIFRIGNEFFSDEWTIGEVAEILASCGDASLIVVSEQGLIGFLLGLPFYIPQIPSALPEKEEAWIRIDSVGRIAYCCLVPGWRNLKILDKVFKYAEDIHRRAGKLSIAATPKKDHRRHRAISLYFRRKNYLPFDNFGHKMHPDYEYLIRNL